MPAVNGEKMNDFSVREGNQWYFVLLTSAVWYNYIILQKHEVIVHYVICFSTVLIHSHILQPLPCLDRKKPHASVFGRSTLHYPLLSLTNPSQVLFPGKWQHPFCFDFGNDCLSQHFYNDSLTCQAEVTSVYFFVFSLSVLGLVVALSNIFCENMWEWDYLSFMSDFFFSWNT